MKAGLFVVAISALLLSVRHEAQQPPPRTMIEGTVVDFDSGAPLAGVEVSLGLGPQAVKTKTDDKGVFVFADVRPGRYAAMEANRAGYLDQAFGVPADVSWRMAVSEFVVQEGQRFQALIKMLRAATISGRIYDTNRAAAVNVRVSPGILQQQAFGPATLGWSVMVRDINTIIVSTDDRGDYRMTGVPPGEYYLSAAPRVDTGAGVAANNPAITYYPGVRNPDQAVPVKVAPGAEIFGIDFTLEPASKLSVSGRIVNSLLTGGREGPDYAYQFALVPRNVRIMENPSSGAIVPDFAIAPDEFELRNIKPGVYDLYLFYRAGAINPRGGDTYYAGRSSIEVSDRDITGLTLTIEPGVDIPGQIVLDDAAKILFPEIRSLSLFFTAADTLPQRFSPTLDSAPRGRGIEQDGSFIIPHAIAGRYYLVPVMNPRVNVYLAGARLGTRDILGQIFEVDANPPGPLVLEISGEAARLEGTVTDRDAKPVPRARVILVPPLSFRQDFTAYKTTSTDADGRFSLAGIRPGSHAAYAFAQIEENAWRDSQFMARYAALGVTIDLARKQTAQRDLKVIPR